MGVLPPALWAARGEPLENVTEVPTGCCRHRCEQLLIVNLTPVIIQAIPAAPIPEPEAFAMMLVALGVLGVAAQRRKSRQHAVARRR